MRQELLIWWETHGRHDLPWKANLTNNIFDPYPIWVAEVMLQQTQLKVMLPFWKKWMLVFPTVDELSKSSLDEVLMIWQGLGYYSRARNLYLASKQLNNGKLPATFQEWINLPGIGRTTAGSILSSSYNSPFPILDGNVRRVLARLNDCAEPPKSVNVLFWEWSENLLDHKRPRDFNQALMDLGSLVCTPRKPNCDLCPWRERCRAYDLGMPNSFKKNVKESIA